MDPAYDISWNPESEYSIVSSSLDNKEIHTCYTDTVIDVAADYTVAVNGTCADSLIIKNAENKKYKVVDCMGDEIAQGVISHSLCEITVPQAGMIFIQ